VNPQIENGNWKLESRNWEMVEENSDLHARSWVAEHETVTP